MVVTFSPTPSCPPELYPLAIVHAVGSKRACVYQPELTPRKTTAASLGVCSSRYGSRIMAATIPSNKRYQH